MTSVRERLGSASDCSTRYLWGAAASVCLADLLRGTCLGGRRRELAGRSVLVLTADQLAAAMALIELDGIARRLILGTPDLSAEHVGSVVAQGGVDAVVLDQALAGFEDLGAAKRLLCRVDIAPAGDVALDRCDTEWVLLTSGTTGAPKMISHSLASLAAPIKPGQNQGADIVWATFYDIRRYGGLQIFLRAMLGRGSMVLSSSAEPPGDYLVRLGQRGVTHISGTPSHWRRAVMSPSAHAISPRYVRLSGEIADQAILNTLRAFYPNAGVGHAFASTEAGVGFEVNDGLEGFPASMVGAPGDVEIKVEDGSLRLRSARTATRYVGGEGAALTAADGFVDTGDIVERRGDRYYFLGRRSGVINIGGLKVYPEEVEAVINRHPAVRMSVVRSRRSPITGALVVADVVLKEERDGDVKREILQICHENLAPHKVPATVRFVPALDVAAAGKLARRDA